MKNLTDLCGEQPIPNVLNIDELDQLRLATKEGKQKLLLRRQKILENKEQIKQIKFMIQNNENFHVIMEKIVYAIGNFLEVLEPSEG